MSQTVTILVVDSSSVNRAEVRRALSGWADCQYEFGEAATGAAALDLMDTLAPGCVLTALDLSDMSALDLIAAVNAKGASSCAVIVLTDAQLRRLQERQAKLARAAQLLADETLPIGIS